MSRTLTVLFNSLAVEMTNKLCETNTQDAAEPKLIAYAVATLGESYFKKQREAAKAAMLHDVELNATAQDKLEKVISETKALDQGMSEVVMSTENYTLVVSTKRGAERLDKTKLRNELIKKFPAKDVDAALLAASVQSAPSVSYLVNDKD